MHFFFILGNHPELSKAEMSMAAHQRGVTLSPLHVKGRVCIVESSSPFELKPFMDALGGVTKCGEILEELPVHGESRAEVINQFLERTPLEGLLMHAPGKRTVFGFSVYPMNRDSVPFRLAKNLIRIGVRFKKRVEEQRGSTRFVTSKHHDLSSVVIGENHVLERGGDICFFVDEERVIVGRTIAVQDYKTFSERDYGRPARDARSGMLPPKLARIMVNLAGANPKTATLLDPFCGSGTIVQEALLAGYTTVIASDISAQAVHDSTHNLRWLANTTPPLGKARVFQANVQDLATHIPHHSVDAIVTEPYLGPPLRGNEKESVIHKNIQNLEKIYAGARDVFRQLLRPGGRLVMVMPVFALHGKTLQPHLAWDGFRDVSFPSWIDTRQFVYAREDQFVRRSILIKEKH
ncbi:MAG: RsmD family RNA methyltransferase [Candidatus Kerfeldbacteria bacterium]|nr:RsmD family RNA methyltransferase [Candidatus Kerfeldbacteria bacterium]